MVGSGIRDFDFRGFRSGFVGFNREGIIPLGGKIDLRRSGLRCCGVRDRANWLVDLISVLVVVLTRDDGEFNFFRGMGQRPRHATEISSGVGSAGAGANSTTDSVEAEVAERYS